MKSDYYLEQLYAVTDFGDLEINRNYFEVNVNFHGEWGAESEDYIIEEEDYLFVIFKHYGTTERRCYTQRDDCEGWDERIAGDNNDWIETGKVASDALVEAMIELAASH